HEIKHIRRKLGLTQKQLADRAGVSQSLIAKVEAGSIEPTYSNAKRIFHALTTVSTAKERVARDLMSKKLVTASEHDDLGMIVKAMKKHEISQVPVVRQTTPVGLVTESLIIDKMMEIKDPQKIALLKAKDIMLECPPIISPETKQTIIVGLLRYFPVLLVAQQGTVLGLISKADIIDLIQR
ncbi:CBS domain-containing protein, partial [Candidatus Woesearchaeota archaeon]|nr:CBS domain-containing protein [Candidatus Woesearchaeota archaeon]